MDKTDEEPVRVATPGGEPAGSEATLYRRDNTPCSRGTWRVCVSTVCKVDNFPFPVHRFSLMKKHYDKYGIHC